MKSKLSTAGILLVTVGTIAAADYKNPVMAGDYPDPSVIRVGTEYWAVATSSEWGPQFPILESKDLVNWQVVGSVFSKRPEWSVANYWAPEITEYKGRYYVYYVGRKKGGPLAVAVATADRPGGPYTDRGPLVAQPAGSIDPVAFDDEKGERYLIWKEDGNSRKQPTIIWMQRLNEDATKLVGESKELIRNDAPWEGAVVEGPFVVKREGWFYLFYAGSGCCGSGCNYAVGVARSRSLHGPYEKCLRNPIVAGNATWKCPGHGSIVRSERERYYFMYHAYAVKDSVFSGRQALLDEVTFGSDGWPTINEGKGPSTTAPSPYNSIQKKVELAFSDDFSDAKLLPGWQWPVADEPQYRIDGGQLVLSPTRKTNDPVGAVLARSTTSGDYTAVAIVSEIKPGTCAGLAAFGDAGNAIGVAVSEAKTVLWRRQKGKHEVLFETSGVKGPAPLGLVARNGHEFQFLVGNERFGEGLQGKHLPPWDRSIRVALTVGGSEDATARFDRFHITSDSAK